MDISNPNLKKIVFPETPLKHALVDFAGGKFKPQNGEVTVDMIIQALGEDFPELIWALAEENFFRGYEQAIRDVHQSSQEKFEE
tara:strand:+ start:1903 stop:2154 length:252 start_codon:yes stop_codon:yes gene_type:complete